MFKVRRGVTLAVLGLCAGGFLVAAAQDDPAKKPPADKDGKADAPNAARFHANVRPARPGSSFVSVRSAGFERRVLNDLPSETDEKTFPGPRRYSATSVTTSAGPCGPCA